MVFNEVMFLGTNSVCYDRYNRRVKTQEESSFGLLCAALWTLYMYFNFPCYYEPPRVHMPYFENPGLNERGAKTGRFKQEELRGCSEAQCKINKDYSEQ